MLGKLSRYLRLLGFDAKYARTGGEKTLVIEARKESRTILTRNTKLKGLPGVFFTESEQPLEQLQQVIDRYDLISKTKFFTRCLLCNEELASINKEEVAGKVPYYTYKNFDKFSACPACHRIYWEGSHQQDMKKRMEAIMKKQER